MALLREQGGSRRLVGGRGLLLLLLHRLVVCVVGLHLLLLRLLHLRLVLLVLLVRLLLRQLLPERLQLPGEAIEEALLRLRLLRLLRLKRLCERGDLAAQRGDALPESACSLCSSALRSSNLRDLARHIRGGRGRKREGCRGGSDLGRRSSKSIAGGDGGCCGFRECSRGGACAVPVPLCSSRGGGEGGDGGGGRSLQKQGLVE